MIGDIHFLGEMLSHSTIPTHFFPSPQEMEGKETLTFFFDLYRGDEQLPYIDYVRRIVRESIIASSEGSI